MISKQSSQAPSSAPRVLVAGIGNVCQSDDGFGVEVARSLIARQPWPESVRIADFGVRGQDLASELLDRRYDLAVFIDVSRRGGRPGTVYIEERDRSRPAPGPTNGDTTAIAPETVLALLARLGGSPPRIVLVGCEPARIERGLGLSDPVANAVTTAVTAIVSLIRDATHATSATGTRR